MIPHHVFTPDAVKHACGGSWLSRPRDPAAHLPGVSIDSRALRPGEIFFAIKGDTHDGHTFVPAVMPTAGLIVVDRDVPLAGLPAGLGILKVASTRKALGTLAAAHRRSLSATRVIAVAGSNGKTTTVRLIDAVLKTKLRGTASQKSFNNDIGVPLTLLGARAADQYVICEVGTNAPGEIATLGAIVEPDVGVITSIGREHLAFLGSIEGVVREEAAILSAVRSGGLAVIPADVPALLAHAALAPSTVTFGVNPRADLRLTRVEHIWEGQGEQARPVLCFTLNEARRYTLGLVGAHNAGNAAAAVAVARRLGVDEDSIALGLASAAGPEMRWQRSVHRGVEVVNDAYNANPDSVLASIATFAALYPPRARSTRTIVLGDMLELGDHGLASHREVGEAVARSGAFDRLITVGTLARGAAEACAAAGAGVDVRALDALDDEGAARLAAQLAPGDVLLLKGSRRMRLERVATELAQPAVHTTIPTSAPTAPPARTPTPA